MVAHVVQHLRPGGIESLALEMLLAERGHARQIVVSLEGRVTDAVADWPRLADLAHRLRFLGKPPGLVPGLPLRLARLLRIEGVGIVQTHHVGPLVYGGVAARLAGAGLLHVEHDAWHLADPARRRLVRGLSAILRPRIAAVSEGVAGAARAVLGRPVETVPNGIDLDRFSPGPRGPARQRLGLGGLGDRPLLVCAARLEPVKGVDILLRAMAGLAPEVALAIAGDGRARPALEAAAASLAPGRVRFLGRIDDMPALYRAGDVCVLPSRAEGLPLSLLEAQAAGCPVVATAVGGVPEAVDPATGTTVPPEDSAALAAAIAATLARSVAPPVVRPIAPSVARSVPRSVTPSVTPSPRGFVEARHGIAAMMDAYARIWAETTPWPAPWAAPWSARQASPPGRS